MDQILKIAEFIIKSFLHIWPYLLVTIPLAVVINLSGASKYINKALSKKPMVSIFLATIVGAFSPFCSCGVIPVITSLLIGGVPLGPVMAFWIASPSMDPEIFMLSVATIGWKLSVWRLAATFVISIAGGIITHLVQKNGYFGESVLRTYRPLIKGKVRNGLFVQKLKTVQLSAILPKLGGIVKVNCCVPETELVPAIQSVSSCQCNDQVPAKDPTLAQRILKESWKSFSIVAKFMALAFLINALIKFYIPENLISGWIGGDSPVLGFNRCPDWHTFLHNQSYCIATGQRIDHPGHEPWGRPCLSYCRSGNNPACHDGRLGHCKTESVFYVSDIRTGRFCCIRIPV